jgi:Carbohydrate family 9 binding domain-like
MRLRWAVVGAMVAMGPAWPAPPVQSVPLAPRGYVCYQASSPISVDGRLDDPAWTHAPWTDRFVDIEGDARPRPEFSTRAKLLWDDTYLYVGADLEEPRLWATMTEHDAVIFRDHDFEVFIDPNGDSHEYYEFEINARGTFWDLLLPRPYKDGGKAVDSWEIPGLRSAVHLEGTLNDPSDTDRGWSVELAFPWRVLGELAHRPSPPLDGDQWRINFSRVEWPLDIAVGAYRKPAGATEHNWVWSPQGVVDMHRPESWGYVQFSTSRSGHVAFVPDATLPARQWLQDVYYAERTYRQAHAQWAPTLELLGLPAPVDPLGGAELHVTGDLFDASVELRRPGQSAARWHIRQDALVWSGAGGSLSASVWP